MHALRSIVISKGLGCHHDLNETCPHACNLADVAYDAISTDLQRRGRTEECCKRLTEIR